jgi:restriction system protein
MRKSLPVPVTVHSAVPFRNGEPMINYDYLLPAGAILLALIFLPIITKSLYHLMRRHLRLKRLKKSGIYEIDRFGGTTFEEYLQVIFREQGYKVKLTADSHDFGGDLILKKDGVKIVVQAKRYKNRVGIKAVQEVIGAVKYYDCQSAMVVTNSFFTKPAKELANKNDVLLWDRTTLIKILNKTKAKDQIAFADERR